MSTWTTCMTVETSWSRCNHGDVIVACCCVLLQTWLDAADRRAELRRFLRDQVPHTYRLDNVVDPQEEERVQRCLLHPLECFLFAEDPREGLAKLKQGSDQSSEICGRVFKDGETVYSCRSGSRTELLRTILVIIVDYPINWQFFGFVVWSTKYQNFLVLSDEQPRHIIKILLSCHSTEFRENYHFLYL